MFISHNYFPPNIVPTDISRAILKFNGYLMYREQNAEFSTPFKFERNHSVVRVYRNVFLLYDEKTKNWVLSRIFIH